MHALLAQGVPLSRNPASRFSSIRQGEPELLLFVDGHGFDCDGDTARLAERLCREPTMVVDAGLAASPAVITLVAALIDQGSLAFDAD